MAQSGKKSKNLKILAQIYNDPKEYKESIVANVRQYFSDSKKVETWLTRAILFFGIFTILFGIFQFKNQIFQPYKRTQSERAITLAAPQITQDLLGLSQKDTDQDGLSDFDELNIYGTSLYLPDSDSDGIADQQEIASNTDPNCPQGNNCFALSELQQDQAGVYQSSGLSGQSAAFPLRSVLQQAGIPTDLLNSLTDAELLQAYQQALNSTADEPSAPTVDLPTDQIENLSPDEVRQLLHDQAGISEDILNQISDEELIRYANQALQQIQ